MTGDFVSPADWDGWSGRSDDPNDEQFGDVVEPADLDGGDDYDAALVGEPYDGAVIGRDGARDGPTAIRRSLAGVKTHHFDAGPASSAGRHTRDTRSGARWIRAPRSWRSRRGTGGSATRTGWTTRAPVSPCPAPVTATIPVFLAV